MAFGDLPPTIHLTVTAAVASTAAELAPALAEAVAAARAHGPVEVPSLELTPEMVTPELIEQLAGGLGLGSGDFSRMATVNSLLNASSPELREALLAGFLSLLQRPTSAAE
jgi:sphinganine-1-phosphate aldolase